MNELDIVLEYLPINIKKVIYANFNNNIKNDYIQKEENLIEEIRLRTNKPLILKLRQETKILEYTVSQQELLQSFDKICENSIYSYKRQICDGYITIRGGNRVGIVGSGVIENGQVINVNYISSLNFRIARQKIGCSNQLIENLIDLKRCSIYNTLIISPPRRRKNHIIKRYN